MGLTVPAGDVAAIRQALEAANIPCADIGRIEPGAATVWRRTTTGRVSFPRPERDEIARIFEK